MEEEHEEANGAKEIPQEIEERLRKDKEQKEETRGNEKPQEQMERLQK